MNLFPTSAGRSRFLAVALCLLQGFSWSCVFPTTTGPGAQGSRQVSSLPDFSLTTLAGETISSQDYDQKVLVVNFWATWCPPCRKEIPEFVDLQARYGEQGLQFIGIALQRPEEVLAFMAEYRMNYPVLAAELEVVELARIYGNEIGALPYTVIIDRQGAIRFVHRGELPGHEAEAVIRPLL